MNNLLNSSRQSAVNAGLPYKTLCRAIGLPEWRLITAEGRRRFPAETMRGKFYYPALTYEGACRIAAETLACSAVSEYTGLVVAFDVPPDTLEPYAEKLRVYENTPSSAADLWIDSSIIRSINCQISGILRIVESYYGPARAGERYTPQELNETGFL